MTAFRPTHLTLALGAALSALLCAPVHAQSLMELVESARTYDTTWQAARAQLEAAARRADQAQAGLRPSAALTSGVTRAQTDVSRPDVERTANTQTLQTDPTVIYGVKERYDGNIRRSDLTDVNPYNTYVIDGLPPTPIAMPGKASIEAALNPKSTDYLYFVAKGGGAHYFSKTLDEHNRAVREYILKKP